MNDIELARVLKEFAADGIYSIGSKKINDVRELLRVLKRIAEQPHCKRCGGFRKLHFPCKKCETSSKDWERPVCPYCGGTRTGRQARQWPKIGKYYICKVCKKLWTVGGIGKGNYEHTERAIRRSLLISERVGYGRCERCRNSEEYLLSSLCMNCSDQVGETAHLYYWRKSQGLCVRCGEPTKSLFCGSCHELSKAQSRIGQRRYRQNKKELILAA